MPKLLSIKLGALFAAILVQTGCVFLAKPLPSGLSAVRLVAVSSPTVEVLTPKIKMDANQPFLTGSVRRVFGSGTTTTSILQITFYGEVGNILAIRWMAFEPAELPRRSNHMYNEGHYKILLSGSTLGTKSIEVKAVIKQRSSLERHNAKCRPNPSPLATGVESCPRNIVTISTYVPTI